MTMTMTTTSTTATMHGTPAALVVSVTSGAENLAVFCRRLSAQTNPSSMYLARVISRGAQVYPERLDYIGTSATILECEFRMRKTNAPVTDDAVHDLLERLSHLDVSRSWLVDERGNSLAVVGESLAAG